MLDPVAVSFGPLVIRWYGIIMAAGFLFGILLALRLASRQGMDPDHLINMVSLIIPAAIIGARLYYVAFEFEQYRQNPLDILAIWKGGLAIHGGLLGGTLAGAWYVNSRRLNFWGTADVLAPSVILGQALGRWGNFINQEAYGGVASPEYMQHFPAFIREQMYIGGAYHHPTFLYESLWNFLVLALLLALWRFRKFYGQIALSYLMLYSAGRFFIEGLRTDSLMAGPFRVAQVVSIILILAALYGYIRKSAKKIN